MLLDHVGIMNRSAEEAVRFYATTLGLEMIKEYVVSSELSQQLFSVPEETKAIVFGKDDVKVEVFIRPLFELPSPNIPHFSLHVKNFPELLKKMHDASVPVISGEHKGKTVHFIRDFSGNLIEIKAAL